MDEGRSWRIHTWARAKAVAGEKLSVEIVRMRMRRAAELGMSYRAYASVRASAGRDVGTMVFTSNALGLQGGGPLDRARAERIANLRHCLRIALLTAPLDPVALAAELPFDRLYRAPSAHAPWPALREAMARMREGRPADSVLLIGAAPGEADWAAAGRLGGYLPAPAYFAA